MTIEAKAPRKGCLSEHVRKLTLTENVDDSRQRFLAVVHTVLAIGGTIEVRKTGQVQPDRLVIPPRSDPEGTERGGMRKKAKTNN